MQWFLLGVVAGVTIAVIVEDTNNLPQNSLSTYR